MNNELIEQIKTNVPLVYEAGKNKGVKEMEPQLEEKYEEGYDQGFAIGKNTGKEEGKQAERNDFWEVFQKGGIAANYLYGFAYNRFNDNNYFPKYDIVVTSGNTTGNYMFYMASELTDTKVTIDVSTVNNLQNSFHSCSKLKYIRKLIVGSVTAFANTFNGDEELEMLNIEGTIAKNGFNVQYSKKLNKTSIESIINALSKTTSGLTVTLSKTAVNNAFGIDVDDASTYPEGSEYYELRQSKSNWTINYV